MASPLWCDRDVAAGRREIHVDRAVIAEGLERGVRVGVGGAERLAGMGRAMPSRVGEERCFRVKTSDEDQIEQRGLFPCVPAGPVPVGGAPVLHWDPREVGRSEGAVEGRELFTGGAALAPYRVEIAEHEDPTVGSADDGWYSFDQGPLHVLMLHTEMSSAASSRQHALSHARALGPHHDAHTIYARDMSFLKKKNAKAASNATPGTAF